ncbi:NAD(+) diphosphatase [Nocardia stercoris]|uniref:NAD(+) diphosphatase n=1 Tax=Nocardia stercoris TaxID=2483361 RepID=A0A3M2LCG0_9NOCA|nr:NAD(+) diphosphatase [Nocardia stercoris]RMI35191.1 NAD(+) diphosphatase [Nocardia stercoris]
MSGFQLKTVPLLSRSALDRAEELRSDEAARRAGWGQARLLRMNRRGQIRLAGSELVFDAAVDLAPEPVPSAVFLGVVEGSHVWAVRDEELSGNLVDLRSFGAALPFDDVVLSLVTTALALLNWHDRAGFSATDGTPTMPVKGGWSRMSEAGHEEFPRLDPAVICLVHDGGERVLLARQQVWPQGLFSILAGFVEAGESLERCVEREIKEEVGIDVREITYLGSQPWPLPRSLMLGFAAVADPEQPLAFTDGEIGEAYWFTRAEVRAALAAGAWGQGEPVAGVDGRPALSLPGSISIARTILESWAAE